MEYYSAIKRMKCHNTNEPWSHYGKWKKGKKGEDHILYDSIDMSRVGNLIETESTLVTA